MRPLRHTQPDEATTLAMENELLRHEVVHLRARLLATAAELRRLEKETSAAGRPVAAAVEAAEPPVPDETLNDLRWLLRRLEGSPLAWVLRRREGYRQLVDAYLREDAG